jgi:hypothetical protein
VSQPNSAVNGWMNAPGRPTAPDITRLEKKVTATITQP